MIIQWISQKILRHSSRGDFHYQDKKPTKMKSGGHGQENKDYLEKHGFRFWIDTEYKNGVCMGHIEKHRRKQDQKKNGHTWFPEN